MAVTLSEEVASKELISEFESTISSIKAISNSDYKILLTSVAYESAKHIEDFIDKTLKAPEQAAIEAQKLIEKERRRRNAEQKRLKEATHAVKHEQENKYELTTKISKIESDLVEFSEANQVLRTSRDEDRTTIEKLQQEIITYKKLTRKWVISLVIFIVILILGFFAWKYWSTVISSLNWLWKGILGIGAAWSFGSFIINLYKAIKRK